MDEIVRNKFESLLQKEKTVLVEFYADWCEPCKFLDGILMEVQNKMGTKIFIQKIDVDSSKELSEYYMVRSVPVLILFKNGEVVWRMNGFLSTKDLLKAFGKFLEV